MTLENPYKESSRREMLAYELGMEDYYEGVDDNDCPFDPDESELCEIWAEGWKAAETDDPDSEG